MSAAFAPFPGFDPGDGLEPHVELSRDNPCGAPSGAMIDDPRPVGNRDTPGDEPAL